MEHQNLTLYELTTVDGADDYGNFIKLIASMMSVEYKVVKVDKEKDTKLFNKSFNGKFPILELHDGKTYLCEPLSIAKYLSNNKHGFYGPGQSEKVLVDQWLDIIMLNVSPVT